MMAEDEHRPVRTGAQLIEPLKLLVADLTRVTALDDSVENSQGHTWQLSFLAGLGGKPSTRERIVVAPHVHEAVAENTQVALKKRVVLVRQAGRGEVALGHDCDWVDRCHLGYGGATHQVRIRHGPVR